MMITSVVPRRGLGERGGEVHVASVRYLCYNLNFHQSNNNRKNSSCKYGISVFHLYAQLVGVGAFSKTTNILLFLPFVT